MRLIRLRLAGRVPTVWAVALSTLAVLGAAAPPLAGQDRAERLFYYVDRETSYESFVAHIDQITILSPSAYSVDEQGIVWGDVDPRVLDLAHEHGVGVMPLIVNPGFNQEMLHDLLIDDEARALAVASMLELCRRHGFRGIQFDFENLHISDREAFTQFYRETADVLHAEGYELSIAVVHRPGVLAGPTPYHAWLMDSWRGGYDLRALAEIGDFISVMTYSQHTRRTPPGPIAGIPWVREVVEHFLQYMPPEKLSLGIPFGGQRWYTSYEERITPELARSYSGGVSHAWALGLLERNGAEVLWSEEHQVPYGFYSRGGTFEWIFFEDVRSFRAKLDLMDEFSLRGFSVWVLGPEDPRVWDVLEARH